MCLELGINDDEDNTVVSGITMDLRLIQGARNWDPDQTPAEGYDSDDYEVPEGGPGAPPLKRRPEASIGGDDPYADGARPDPSEQMAPRTAEAHRRRPSPSVPGPGPPSPGRPVAGEARNGWALSGQTVAF